MRKLHDDIKLSKLSIPGTRGSLTSAHVTKTQSMTLGQQLMAGIRFVDLELKQNLANADTFDCYFDQTPIFKSNLEVLELDDVLSDIQNFLYQHPGETVLIQYRIIDNVQWDRLATKFYEYSVNPNNLIYLSANAV